ncbi:uncharacterized protein LOC115970180 [Quercus lobata]|uniref:uncharacterized protein LOC115970180 n=1 Tax=Quercus lobata TaxID=97700 RepID=UPI001246038F|nr:uncharacterized protein LOC115970180 [Quercus lobata]
MTHRNRPLNCPHLVLNLPFVFLSLFIFSHFISLPHTLSLSQTLRKSLHCLPSQPKLISVSKPHRNNPTYSHLFCAKYVPFNHLTKPPTSPTPSTKSCTALNLVGCSTSSTISSLSKSRSRSSEGWDEGVLGMQLGEVARLRDVPSAQQSPALQKLSAASHQQSSL